MKIGLAAATLLCCFAASAQIEPPSVVGVWVLSPESRQHFTTPCQSMHLEFTEDGHLIRTTGGLVYTTSVRLTPNQGGWLLAEKLESQNGQPSCSGMPSSQVVEHLKRSAYVEIEGQQVRYYRWKGDKQFMEFVRTGT